MGQAQISRRRETILETDRLPGSHPSILRSLWFSDECRIQRGTAYWLHSRGSACFPEESGGHLKVSYWGERGSGRLSLRRLKSLHGCCNRARGKCRRPL